MVQPNRSASSSSKRNHRHQQPLPTRTPFASKSSSLPQHEESLSSSSITSSSVPLERSTEEALPSGGLEWALSPLEPSSPTDIATPSSQSISPPSVVNPALDALVRLLQTPTSHPDLEHDVEGRRRAKAVWKAYTELPNKEEVPADMWSDLLRGVAQPVRHSPAPGKERGLIGRSGGRYPRVLTRYTSMGHEERFQTIVRDKMNAGVDPRPADYEFIIEHFALNGYVKGVEAVYAAMVQRAIESTARTFELRLEAIATWVKLYDSMEARHLLSLGKLYPRDLAMKGVPPLVARIMTDIERAAFAPILSPATVDAACQIFADMRDLKAFNLLARYGYGVDLDVPDSVPEEFLARIRRGEDVTRGFSLKGLDAVLQLYGKGNEIYKMLSMFEVFAHPLPSTSETPASLARTVPLHSSSPYGSTESAPFFAPPMPASSALSMMNVTLAPSAPPHDLKTISADSPETSDPVDSLPSASPPPSAPHLKLRPRHPDFRFPDQPEVPISHTTFNKLLHSACTHGGPRGQGDPFLAKHILTLALSRHYTSRSRRIGKLLRALSLPSHAVDERARLRAALEDDDARLRTKFFVWFAKCCASHPGPRSIRYLEWAEGEARMLRTATALDLGVLESAMRRFALDDQVLASTLR